MQQATAGRADAGTGERTDELVGVRVGPHVLLRDAADAGRERAFLDRLPGVAGELFVLLARGAYARPQLADDLAAALAPVLLDAAARVSTVWLGVDDLAPHADLVAAIASAQGPDLLAPQGPLAFSSGPGVYVGPTSGGTGWWRFPAGGPPEPAGSRFPAPAWEDDLPSEPITAASAVAEPVPAGVVVRDRDTEAVSPVDLAFHVVTDPDRPQLVVGTPAPAAEAVAAVVEALASPTPLLLAPLGPGAADPVWVGAVTARAAELGHDLLLGAGARLAAPEGGVRTVALDAAHRELFRPFAAVLRPVAGAGQEVVGIADAPPDWETAGPRAYRPAAGGSVLAEVVADGLVVSAQDPAGEAGRSLDPQCWVLDLGRTDEVVGADLLQAAEHLLGGLDEHRRERVDVRLVGRWDGTGRDALERLLPPESLPPERLPPEPEPPRVEGAAAPEPEPAPVPVEPTYATPPSAPAAPAAVATVSRTPLRTDATAAAVAVVPDPSVAPVVGPVVGPPVTTASGASGAPGGPAAPALADALAVAQRSSTAGEQQRFAAAVGDAFTEALATVNAAMATWPSLRAHEGPGAKADLVAVCLHLEEGVEGDAGAARLNAAVRHGREGAVDGQLPCLVSGLRRLPTHRRPVLRQGVADPVPDAGAAPGWFTEPGFLSASTDLDVTVPGARYDVLILPASARRTAELTAPRPVDEAVFLAGARFKALAVREHDVDPAGTVAETESDAAPRVALLVRELAPDESPAHAEAPGAAPGDGPGRPPAGSDAAGLDDRDRAALGKLDRALAGRRRATLRPVDDPPTVGRLTAPMLAVRAEALALRRAAAGTAVPAVAAGS